MELGLLERVFDGKEKPMNLPLSVLQSITENFDVKREIGRGGYGVVYKGLLQNGVVAVKKAWTTGTTKDEKFDREVQNLMKVEHKNVVRFLGYCSITENRYGRDKDEPEKFQIWERLLCFEYVSNGSLKKHITGELRGLEWNTRYEIIKGICQGLCYLHNGLNIVHRDLKPDNILLDDLMIPKIADLGISKLLEDGTSTNDIPTDRAFSMWYCSPEFADNGVVSRKLDIYSLGVIIIELVTGLRTTPDIKHVLRRWRYRWNMLVKGKPSSPLCYQQVARCIEIGLMCKDKEPKKRPTILNIIDYLNGTKSANGQIINAHESSIGQTIPFWNDLLWIEPLELYFPFKVNKQILCTLHLTNETNSYVAFYIQNRTLLQYSMQPNRGILPPLSGRMVNITFQTHNKVPQDMQHFNAFTVKSTKLDRDHTDEDVTEDMFRENMSDEVTLDVVFDAQLRAPCTFKESNADSTYEPLTALVPPNQVDTEASTSMISPSVTKELIQVDPSELRFPFLPNEMLSASSSIKLENITDNYVVFVPRYMDKNEAAYTTYPQGGVLPPWSTKEFVVTREAKKSIAQSIECNDMYLLFSTAVGEDFIKSEYVSKLNDFYKNQGDRKWHMRELSVVLDPIYRQESSDGMRHTEELIQVDPHEIRFPFIANESISVTSSVKVVNNTDNYVAFVARYMYINVAEYTMTPRRGVLPPRSTEELIVRRAAKEAVPQSIECNDMILLFSSIVREDFKIYEKFYETQVGVIWHKTELGVLLELASPLQPSDITTNTEIISSPLAKDLIKVHPRVLRFPFLPDEKLSASSSIKLENITDEYVAYILKCPIHIMAKYKTRQKKEGIIPPRSTVELIVMRTAIKAVPQSIECNDKYHFFSTTVSQDFKNSDLKKFYDTQPGKIWRRTSLDIVLEEYPKFESSDGMPY